ncbi:hypothetical protein D3C77_661340 [compost metagenome]
MRPGFFDDAFKGYVVPPGIRAFAIAFCTRFNVRGLSDPCYLSNLVALKLKVGDGHGNFDHDKTPDETDLAKIGDHLLFAYSTCIGQTEPATTADTINQMVKAALAGAAVEELFTLQAALALAN